VCALQGESRSGPPPLRVRRAEDFSRCARHNPFRRRKGAKPKASASGEPGVQGAWPSGAGAWGRRESPAKCLQIETSSRWRP